MARKSDGNLSPRLDDLAPRKEDLVRGGNGDEKKKKGVNLDMISIVKTYDKSSPYL